MPRQAGRPRRCDRARIASGLKGAGISGFSALAQKSYEQMAQETAAGQIKPLDPESAAVLQSVLARGDEVVIVSNSGTERIRQLLGGAGIEAREDPGPGHLRIRGSARKFLLSDAPRHLDVGDYRIPLDRPHYEQILLEERPDVVVGDVFSLDLALPLDLVRRADAGIQPADRHAAEGLHARVVGRLPGGSGKRGRADSRRRPHGRAPVTSPSDMTFAKHSREFRVRRAWNWLALGLHVRGDVHGPVQLRLRQQVALRQLRLGQDADRDDHQLGDAALRHLGDLQRPDRRPVRRPQRDADRRHRAPASSTSRSASAPTSASSAPAPLLLGYLATMWSLNMYFQSYSALALIKVNSGWFHVSERGVFSAIFGSMIQSGRARGLRPDDDRRSSSRCRGSGSSSCRRSSSRLHGVLTFLVVRTRRRTPGSATSIPQDATSGDTEAITLGYVARKVFTNPVAITIAVAEFCTGLVRKGFEEWFPRYMQEVQHLPLDSPIFQKDAFGDRHRRHRSAPSSPARSRTGCSSTAGRRSPSSATRSRSSAWRWSGRRRASTGSSPRSS